MSEALTKNPTKTDLSAATLLRAVETRVQDRATWQRRLDDLVAADRRRQRAFVAAGIVYVTAGCTLAPLGLSVVTGLPLPPLAAWTLAIAALASAATLPVALVRRRLARYRHGSLLVALHDRGASLTRDADGWVLRDRHTQRILATRARVDDDRISTDGPRGPARTRVTGTARQRRSSGPRRATP